MSLKNEVLDKSISKAPLNLLHMGFFLLYGHTAIKFLTLLFYNSKQKKMFISEHLYFLAYKTPKIPLLGCSPALPFYLSLWSYKYITLSENIKYILIFFFCIKTRTRFFYTFKISMP